MSAETGSPSWDICPLTEDEAAQLREEFRQYEKDRLFFNAHLTELYEQNPDMYVAIYREELAAVAATSKELAEQLLAKGIRPGATYWQFLSAKRTILIPVPWVVQD